MNSELRLVVDTSFEGVRESDNGTHASGYRLIEDEGKQDSSGRDVEEEDSDSDWSDEPEQPRRAHGGTILGLQNLPRERRMCISRWLKAIKIGLLTVFMVSSAILFIIKPEETPVVNMLHVTSAEPVLQSYNQSENWVFARISLVGPFRETSYKVNGSIPCSRFLFVCGPNVTRSTSVDCPIQTDMSCVSVLISNDPNTFTEIKKKLNAMEGENFYATVFTSHSEGVTLKMSVMGEILGEGSQTILALVILVLVYVLIGFEIVHRTLAALIGSTAVLAILSVLNKRPTLETAISWIDLETVCLLVGMMTLVGIFAKTGFFDYTAIKAYKVARGREWPLIILLCSLTAFMSAFLDNVTTILLITPVTIRLCKVLRIDPRPVIIAEVVFSNIGGTATAIGDPPNIIIFAHDSMKAAGISFTEFTAHLLVGVIFAIIMAYILITVMYTCCFQYVKWRNTEAVHISELKSEIRMWERAEKNIPALSGEEVMIKDALRTKIREVKKQLQTQQQQRVHETSQVVYKTIKKLEQKYSITDKSLLIKSLIVVTIVIILFFLSNAIPNITLGVAWIAIFGAVTLIILSGIKDLEEVMHKIEWSTLLFFAGLFVMMKGLENLGLLEWIGYKLVYVIERVPQEHQNLVAIILILWVSAFISAFIDNIPFVTAMIPVIVTLSESPDLCIDLRPMVWAVAFGGCLGGNGTLIGASANVVSAGIAEQNGYKITFKYFMKIGFPVMIATVFSVMVYLLIVHIGIGWNIEKCSA